MKANLQKKKPKQSAVLIEILNKSNEPADAAFKSIQIFGKIRLRNKFYFKVSGKREKINAQVGTRNAKMRQV